MNFKPINKESNLEMIIQQIKDQIKKGILKPGEKLPSETEFATKLKVSRSSIREAIHALAFSGYLEVIHGKGSYILPIAYKYDQIIKYFSEIPSYSLDSLMEARVMLEGEFVRLAALNANKEEVEIIENIFNQIVFAKDLNSFFVKDLEFHLAIASATHNPIINGIMKIIVEILFTETKKIIEISKYTKSDTIKITKKLVEAIKQKNADLAKELMCEHIRNIRFSLY